jgi:hypothetical protein
MLPRGIGQRLRHPSAHLFREGNAVQVVQPVPAESLYLMVAGDLDGCRVRWAGEASRTAASSGSSPGSIWPPGGSHICSFRCHSSSTLCLWMTNVATVKSRVILLRAQQLLLAHIVPRLAGSGRHGLPPRDINWGEVSDRHAGSDLVSRSRKCRPRGFPRLCRRVRERPRGGAGARPPAAHTS